MYNTIAKLHTNMHYLELRSHYQKNNSLHPNGIAVLEVDSIAPRTNADAIFAEGHDFADTTVVGVARSCLAPVPAPHVEPTIPNQSFLTAAQETLKTNARLSPGLSAAELFSGQVCLWYKHENMPEDTFDLSSIYNLSTEEQGQFAHALSIDTTRGIQFIRRLTHRKPIIWTSTGNASDQERQKEGLSRGGPTIKRGHIQISDYNADVQPVVLTPNLKQADKLTHFVPWISLLQEKHGDDLATIVHGEIDRAFEGRIESRVTPLDEIVPFANGAQAIRKGLQVTYANPIPLSENYIAQFHISGIEECNYQQVKAMYAEYYNNIGNSPDNYLNKIAEFYVTNGLTHDRAQALAQFIIGIQPTYTQLLSWTQRPHDTQTQRLLDKKLEKYERFRQRGNRRSGIMYGLMDDTFKDPDQSNTIQSVWPVHGSYTFVIDDYEVDDNQTFVHGLKLYPIIASTETAPERALGLLLKRPVTAQK